MPAIQGSAPGGGGGGVSEAEAQALVDAGVADLVDSSPAALNTLNELAAALGDDANFATTVTNLLAGKAATTDVVLKALFDANTILAATSDNTPAALTVGASTFVGRKASGDISAMSLAEVRPLLGMPVIHKVTRAGTGSLTTTSTTKTAVDSTNLGFQTLTLAVGDLVRCTFACVASNSNSGWNVFFDVEVDQPTSANVYVAAGCDYGITSFVSGGVHFRHSVNAVGDFVATEAGSHGFRPVWGVEGNTGKIWIEASGTADNLVTFEIQHWPAALVV